MIADIVLLENQLLQARAEVDHLQRQLDQRRRNCKHTWDHPEGKYNPIRTEGRMYTDHMGFRPVERYMEPTSTPRWTKTCTTCGQVIETTETRTEEKVLPKW